MGRYREEVLNNNLVIYATAGMYAGEVSKEEIFKQYMEMGDTFVKVELKTGLIGYSSEEGILTRVGYKYGKGIYNLTAVRMFEAEFGLTEYAYYIDSSNELHLTGYDKEGILTDYKLRYIVDGALAMTIENVKAGMEQSMADVMTGSMSKTMQWLYNRTK